MRPLPAGYDFLPIPADRDAHIALFERVEDMARDEDVGADPQDDSEYLIAVITHPDRVIAGAVWADRRDDEAFAFHMAIHREHQGKGLSHVLIEQALAEYQRLKTSHPDMSLSVTVIDPRMAAALYQHGFVAMDDWGDESFAYSYAMAPVENISTILLEAHRNDTSLFFDAIAAGAALSGLADDEVARRLKAWGDAPFGTQHLDLPIAAATAVLTQLPLPPCHQDFLHAQHRLSTPDVPRPPREPNYRLPDGLRSEPVVFRPKR